MLLSTVREVVGAKVLCCEDKLDSIAVPNAYACDLLSDILAFACAGTLLITGLTHIQLMRTVHMLDVPAVLFVRGKVPSEDVVRSASALGVPLLLTPMTMFEACGRLYAEGLSPCLVCRDRVF